MVSQDLTQTTIPKCFGDSNGVIVVSINGGNNGGFTFEWSDATGVVSIDSISADGLQAGIYSVVVTDSEGCTGSLAGMVLQDPPPVLGSYEDPAPLACFGDETTLRIESIAGGSGGPYQFSLDYGALLDIDFPVSLSGGDHYITYYDFKYCSYTDTITVDEPDEITVEFDPAVHEIKLGDTTYQLKPIISTGPNAVESFTWTPAEFLHWPDTLYPYVFTFESQTYTLVVVDEHGCSGTGSVVINVDPDRNVYIPNI
ncbi:MAG: SprB repeat-containing protein, partial [Lewinellaceae bacterium]|nr:SprB repeat-containing protein [Lewinellaceae bacterium]